MPKLSPALLILLTLLPVSLFTQSARATEDPTPESTTTKSVNQSPPQEPVDQSPPLKPEDRPAAAKLALDPDASYRARLVATFRLAFSGYTPEGAAALTTIALDPNSTADLSNYAVSGLRNYSNMPQEMQTANDKKFLDAFLADLKRPDTKPRDAIITMVAHYHHYDLLYNTVAKYYRNDPFELDLLANISNNTLAIARLDELRAATSPTAKSDIYTRQRIANAYLTRRNKRGIDLLIESLNVPEFLPADPATSATDLQTYRANMHVMFTRVASILNNKFGYQSHNDYTPDLTDAIPVMTAWWKENQSKWTF